MSQEHELKVKLLERKNEKEIADLRRIVDQKNQELEDYRIQLSGILQELDQVKGASQRFFKPLSEYWGQRGNSGECR